ncbi:hypothetical protein ACH5RR_013199 [Cinchona calisaya]|uniref:Uncharacterized protein n=1 Tax=Cinchona calisaya TaxID=153742 RepID=A0ABD3A205_9GENT
MDQLLCNYVHEQSIFLLSQDTTNFKEWRLVLQEILRFTKADASFLNVRPLRFCALFDSYPSSLPYVARFHAKMVLKFREALLISYGKNEVKFAEINLDSFRMLQCLEWEPSGSFYQNHQVESQENGALVDLSAASGLISINLATDMTDPSRKSIIHRPSVTQLIAASSENYSMSLLMYLRFLVHSLIQLTLARQGQQPGAGSKSNMGPSQKNLCNVHFIMTAGVIKTEGPRSLSLLMPNKDQKLFHSGPDITKNMSSIAYCCAQVIATICEELAPDSVMLLYPSATGNADHGSVSTSESSGSSRKSSKSNHSYHEKSSYLQENHVNGMGDSSHYFESCLWLDPSRDGGSNNLYPGDIIPFTRRPIFLIVYSDNSHAFKACLSKLCYLFNSPDLFLTCCVWFRCFSLCK